MIHRLTPHQDIQRDLIEELRALLARAERGELTGIYVASIDAKGQCMSMMLGEERFTLYGVAFVGIASRAGRESEE